MMCGFGWDVFALRRWMPIGMMNYGQEKTYPRQSLKRESHDNRALRIVIMRICEKFDYSWVCRMHAVR